MTIYHLTVDMPDLSAEALDERISNRPVSADPQAFVHLGKRAEARLRAAWRDRKPYAPVTVPSLDIADLESSKAVATRRMHAAEEIRGSHEYEIRLLDRAIKEATEPETRPLSVGDTFHLDGDLTTCERIYPRTILISWEAYGMPAYDKELTSNIVGKERPDGSIIAPPEGEE